MSVSWSYLTRRFIGQNYRDSIAMAIIGSFFMKKALTHWSVQNDNHYVMVIIINVIIDSKECILKMRVTFNSETEITKMMLQSK